MWRSNSLIHGLCCHHPALVLVEPVVKFERWTLGSEYQRSLWIVGFEDRLMDEIDEQVEMVG